MWLNSSSLVHKQDLVLEKPFVNVPGMLGFAARRGTTSGFLWLLSPALFLMDDFKTRS